MLGFLVTGSLPPHWRTLIQKGIKMWNPLLVRWTACQSLIMNSREMWLSIVKQICKNKTGFYLKTVRGICLYLYLSFILDHEYTQHSRHDNPWTSKKNLCSLTPGRLVLQKVLANELIHYRQSCFSFWQHGVAQDSSVLKVPKTCWH